MQDDESGFSDEEEEEEDNDNESGLSEDDHVQSDEPRLNGNCIQFSTWLRYILSGGVDGALYNRSSSYSPAIQADD